MMARYAFFALLAVATVATADVPHLLNVQGMLTDGLGEPVAFEQQLQQPELHFTYDRRFRVTRQHFNLRLAGIRCRSHRLCFR